MKVLLLCWRDTHHPEGGGSERYLEHVAQYLANQGHEVVYRTARYPGAAGTEVSTRNAEGEDHGPVLFSRGGRSLTVYPAALWAIARSAVAQQLGGLRGPVATALRRRIDPFHAPAGSSFRAGQKGSFGVPDVVVDTQNGVPFFASLLLRRRVIVLTHHCHREQWVIAGPLLSRVGWFVESRLSPLLHRRNRWVTVSAPSAEEFSELGVPSSQFDIIRNGVDPIPASLIPEPPRGTFHVVTLSRLVPHKQIEHALNSVAALSEEFPHIRLDVIGSGWWAERLRQHARVLGIEGKVTFHGHVTEELKHRVLSHASVHAMPSRKEGWGLAVIEAAQHAVPTVGYASSAGLRDSVVDGSTGILCDDQDGMTAAIRRLISEPDLRDAMGEAAKTRAAEFSWDATGRAWERLLQRVAEQH